ncbi:MarR family winged helix-turn-helix transcriptional regulator [Dermabacteraceae bacterium P13095]
MSNEPCAQTDEVDRIISAWHGVRPDMDTAPLAVVSRLTRVNHHMDALRKQVFSESGLEPWEFDVLSTLRRAGDAHEMTPGDLTRETLVTSGTMTVRVAKLAKRGLIVRLPDPEDGRGAIVRLLPDGVELVDKAMERLLEREQEMLRDLSPAERASLAASLRVLLLSLNEKR